MIKVNYILIDRGTPAVGNDCEFFQGIGYLVPRQFATDNGIKKPGVACFSTRPLKGGVVITKDHSTMSTLTAIRSKMGLAMTDTVFARFEQSK